MYSVLPATVKNNDTHVEYIIIIKTCIKH